MRILRSISRLHSRTTPGPEMAKKLTEGRFPEKHDELNKIILFLQCPAGGEVVRASAPTGALPKIVTETRGRAYGPLVMKAAAHRTRREDASRAQALSHILTEATATTGPPAPTCTGAPNYQLMPAMGILRKTHMTR